MSRLDNKRTGLALRKQRIQTRVKGTAKKPRLSVFVSNSHVSAQIIDDTTGKTLVSVTTEGNKTLKGTKTEKAAWVGKEIAKAAKTKKVKQVVFDRNGKLYHGRVKTLADAAREEGLEF
jgi:large subunit ribosomal protein L18